MDVEITETNRQILNNIKSDVKKMKTDIEYIKERIKILNAERDKSTIDEVQTKQNGWFFYPQ
tara:strand:+ start:582 stop:767 length:186 start_codon:yes stop_codon:yes gene_type:complete